MNFKIRDIQICGRSGYVFTDNPHPQIAVFMQGKAAEKIKIQISHNGILDWKADFQGGNYFEYAGNNLQPKTSYVVQVTAISGQKKDRKAAAFDTGFMGTSWQGRWIEPEQDEIQPEQTILFHQIFSLSDKGGVKEEKLHPVQEIHRIFSLDKLPEQAILYATAHGVYDLYMNGKSVPGNRLAPEISVYPKCLYYQRYDITDFLIEGENELLVYVADGWWGGRIGLSGDSCQYGNRLGFLAQLELKGAGKVQIIGSDVSFMSRCSQIRYADLYIGEKWDLTIPKSSWKSCVEVSFDMDNLNAQELQPLAITGEKSGCLFRTPSGDLIADFGQTLAGCVRIQFQCSGQRKIVLEHCEVLDENGEFYQNIMGRNKQQQDILISDHWPVEFSPRFTYHGFRYVRIQGVSEEEIRFVAACIIGTPLHFHGNFSCTDARLNQLQQNIRWSMRGNFVSIPTDCPQREKMGWTGDIQIFAPTACFNADVRGFLRSWLANMRLEQCPNGEIPNYIPAFPVMDQMQRDSHGSNSSAGWGDSCILVPLAVYRATGDLKILLENLPMMERWLSYIEEMRQIRPENFDSLSEAQKARLPYLWQAGSHYGDWLIPSLQNCPDGVRRGKKLTGCVISSAFYAVTLRAYIQVLKAIIKAKSSADVRLENKLESAEVLLAKVKWAVREEYVQADGKVQGDLQGLYVIMLYADIVEGELRERVAARLVELIEENGRRLDTGFVTTPWLLEILCSMGYRELAYRLLFQEEEPSWLYQVKHGATTIWENWTAVRPDGQVTASSMNHYAFGCVGEWMYRHIGGIWMEDVDSSLIFRPDTDMGIWGGCGVVWHPNGKVACRWERKEKQLLMWIQTPIDCQAFLDGKSLSLQPGEYEISKNIGESKLLCFPCKWTEDGFDSEWGSNFYINLGGVQNGTDGKHAKKE